MLMMWLLGNSDPQKTTRKPFVSDNWERKFQLFDKDPYGQFLFTSLWQAHLDSNQKMIQITDWVQLDTLLEKKQQTTMVFTGNLFGLQNNEIDSILSKVSRGSDLFLSYRELTDNINERLFKTQVLSYDYSDSVNVFIGNNRFTQFFIYQNDTIANQWKAFTEVEPLDSIYRSLSSFMEMTDFIRIKHGKGFVYLHTNPEFFYNYQLKRVDGFRYATFVINQFSKDRPLYFLELGRLMDNYGTEDTSSQEGSEGKHDDSYLQFLLKSPALVTAMGLTILGLILFLIFRAKRLQPIVPYIPKKKNMTLEFAETITSIYAAKQNPYGLLQVQRKNFLDAINKHFFVDLSRKDGDRERQLQILSQKSNVTLNELIDLLKLFETTEASRVDDNYIVEVAKAQHKFYEKTGIIQGKILQKVNIPRFAIRRALLFSYLLILIGLSSIIYGFYLLLMATGVGILLWPIGVFFLTVGVLRISKVWIRINGKEILFYPMIGKTKKYTLDELVSISRLKHGVELQFTDNRTLAVNYWEMSRFDKAQFELFLSKQQQFEL